MREDDRASLHVTLRKARPVTRVWILSSINQAAGRREKAIAVVLGILQFVEKCVQLVPQPSKKNARYRCQTKQSRSVIASGTKKTRPSVSYSPTGTEKDDQSVKPTNVVIYYSRSSRLHSDS
jgi:hypothetical protein